MDFTVTLNDTGLTVKNNGSAYTMNLGPGNSLQMPDGASVNPPDGKYWHIDGVSGGAVLEGTHGPLNMPSGSSATFYIDNV